MISIYVGLYFRKHVSFLTKIKKKRNTTGMLLTLFAISDLQIVPLAYCI